MTLRGLLADVGVVDLLQLFHAGRRSGELLVTGIEGDARLYYAEGKLVHAVKGDIEGLEVLVDLVGWTEGEIEFRHGVRTERTSLDLDLHRALIQALMIRDERKMAEAPRKVQEERHQKEAEQARPVIDQALCAHLAELLTAYPFVRHACVLVAGGAVKAEASRGESVPEGIADLRAALTSLLAACPRPSLKRGFFEGEIGTVALARLGDSDALVVLCDRTATMGVVSVAVGKLAGGLAEVPAPVGGPRG